MIDTSILFPIVITWIIVAAIVLVFAATRKPLSSKDETPSHLKNSMSL